MSVEGTPSFIMALTYCSLYPSIINYFMKFYFFYTRKCGSFPVPYASLLLSFLTSSILPWTNSEEAALLIFFIF